MQGRARRKGDEHKPRKKLISFKPSPKLAKQYSPSLDMLCHSSVEASRDHVIELLRHFLGYDGAAFLVKDKRGFRQIGAVGNTTNIQHLFDIGSGLIETDFSRHLSAQHIYNCPDLLHADDLPIMVRDDLLKSELRSVVAVPIVSFNNTLGAIAFFHHESTEISAEDGHIVLESCSTLAQVMMLLQSADVSTHPIPESASPQATDAMNETIRNIHQQRDTTVDQACQLMDDLGERLLGEIELKYIHEIQDATSSLFNEVHFSERADTEIARELRQDEGLSLLSIRVLELNSIRDSFGGEWTQEIIASLGEAVRNECRNNDAAFRFEDDTLNILLRDTSEEDAINLATRIKRCADSLLFAPNQHDVTQLTLACGVAQYRNYETIESLLHRAHHAMGIAGIRDCERIWTYTEIEHEIIDALRHNAHAENPTTESREENA